MEKICSNCGKPVDIKTGQVEFIEMQNFINLENEYCIKLHYQTFCRNCGELVYGVQRKQLKIKDIINIMENKEYGKH